MPVTDIQKLGRNTTQTWEEAFESVDKTSEAFHDLVEEFVKFVGDWKEFSDVRRDRMSEYIEGLDDVKGHWSDINRWVSDNSDTLETYVGSLSDIKTLFQDISSEIGGIRRQTLDRVNVIRNLSRLANESIVAAKQEGGLTESSVRSLQKKSTLLIGQYETQLKIMGVSSLEDDANAEKIRKEEERRVQILERQVEVLETLKNSGQRLQASDVSRLRYLKEQLDFHKVQLEYVNQASRDAVQGLDKQIKRQTELFRIQRSGVNAGPNALGANRVDVASRVLRKAGMGEEVAALGRDYGEWITNRVSAQQSLENATSARDLAKQSLDAATADRNAALNKAGSFTRESNADIAKFEAEKAKSLAENQQLQQQLASLRSARYKIGTNPDEETGRYRGVGGRFVDTEKVKDLDKALQSTYQKLQNNQKVLAGIDASIKHQKDLQEKYNQELSTTQKLLNSAQVAFEEAEENQQKAQKEKDEVFGKEFDLTGKIVENFRKGYLELGKWGGPLGAAVALITSIFTNFLKTNAEAAHVKQLVGEWTMGLAGANFGQASILETTKLIGELTEKISLNPVAVFDRYELGRMSEAKKLLGLTADQAAGLGVQSKLNVQTADEYRKSLQRGIGTGQILNKTVISQGVATREALAASDAIKVSMGNNAEAIGRAVVAAKSLGMSLQDVENISRSLMNFESSISAEMQAQLLTGHQLNLAKAREYALNNDLEGVTREIGRQGVTMVQFGRMNYIQQEGLAKALGMSRDQMAKMLVTQALSEGLSAKQIANAGLMNEKQIEAISLQENWQATLNRITGALTPILQLLLPIVELVSKVAGYVSGAITWILEPIDKLTTGLSSVIGKWTNWGAIVRKDESAFAKLAHGVLSFCIVIPLAIAGIIKVSRALLGLGATGTGVFARLAAGMRGLAQTGPLQNLFTVAGPSGRRHSLAVLARRRSIDATLARQVGQTGVTAAAGTSRLGGAFSSLNVPKILKGALAVGIMIAAIAGLGLALRTFKEVGIREVGVAAASIVLLAGTLVVLGAIMNGPLAAAVILGAAVFGAITLMVMGLGKALQSLAAVPGSELQSIAAGIRSIAGAVAELSTKLVSLDVGKIGRLRRELKKLQKIKVQAVPIAESTGETQEIQGENLRTSAQETVIKQAQVQASAQQISVEQKATDLTEVKNYLIRIETAIKQSRPDWNWLEFGNVMSRELPWIASNQ